MDENKQILRKQLLDEKRHQEVVSGIAKIPESLEVLAKKIEKIEVSPQFLEKLSGIVAEIREIGTAITESNNRVVIAIEQRRVPESFELIRGANGTISNINVNYTSI